MTARLMLDERHPLSEHAFVEIVVWRLSSPLPGCRQAFKYRLAYMVKGFCVLRYDNEPGKGDHKHMGEEEVPYVFTTPERLLDDFWNDVNQGRF